MTRLIGVRPQMRFHLSGIESALNLKFQRTIEKTWKAEIGNGTIYYTAFHTIAFLGVEESLINEILSKLGIIGGWRSMQIFQDFNLDFQGKVDHHFQISDDKAVLELGSPAYTDIVAFVICQSMGLDYYENEVNGLLEQIRNGISKSSGFNAFARNAVIKLLERSSNLRHELILDLSLLDKPQIAWEDEVASTLYDNMAEVFELEMRYETIHHKIKILREDTDLISNILNQRSSIFTEWLIVILFAVDIAISLLMKH